MQKMDDIERSRKIVDDNNRAVRARLNQQVNNDPIKQIAASIKSQSEVEAGPTRESSSLLQTFDQACCEVEVY
jgi:hypothetical protein